jgi:dihydroneopterin aldolase
MGFDDAAAHHMALLAMEQFGRVLASFDARWVLADSLAALRQAVHDSKVPIWSPTRMTLDATDMPASWDITSDSLAAWLAGQLGARRLVLMKQVALPRDPASVDDLAARGIVDKAFPRFLARSGAAASIIGPADHMAVADALCDDPRIGTPIALP